MSRASALASRVAAILKRVAPPDRKVYRRTVIRTGGDDLIGRPGSVAVSDSLLDPQPYYARSGRQIGGDDTEVYRTGAEMSVGEGYDLIVATKALSLSDLQNPNVLLVMKDAAGTVEVYRITDWEPLGFSGEPVLYLVSIRSTKR